MTHASGVEANGQFPLSRDLSVSSADNPTPEEENLESSITVEIHEELQTPNIASRDRLHWGDLAKIKRQHRGQVYEALFPYESPEPGGFWEVTLTRFGPRALDDDNLAFAFKSVRDEVAAFLKVNDGDREHIRFSYAQVPSHEKKYSITISSRETKFPPVLDLSMERFVTDGEPKIINRQNLRRLDKVTKRGKVLARVPRETGTSELVISLKHLPKIGTYLAAHVEVAPFIRRFGSRVLKRRAYRTLGLGLRSREELLAMRQACDLALQELEKDFVSEDIPVVTDRDLWRKHAKKKLPFRQYDEVLAETLEAEQEPDWDSTPLPEPSKDPA